MAPCCGQTFGREEHTGSGKVGTEKDVWEVVEMEGAGTTTAGYKEGARDYLIDSGSG